MSKIAVFYGSTTGTCETLAGVIASKLGTDAVFSAADAMGIIYEAVQGANIVGAGMPTDGYSFSSSQAVVNGAWVGCALDDVNEPDQSEARINAWLAKVRA